MSLKKCFLTIDFACRHSRAIKNAKEVIDQGRGVRLLEISVATGLLRQIFHWQNLAHGNRNRGRQTPTALRRYNRR